MTDHVLYHSLLPISAQVRHKFERAVEAKNYPRLAYLLGIKTIHISE